MHYTTFSGLCTALLLSFSAPAFAAPLYRNNIDHEDALHMSPLERRAEDFYLRIMPLGASITKGQFGGVAPNTNGYRKYIRDRLRFDEWKVNMVGSVANFGTMADRDNEGHPGYWVNQVRDVARESIPTYRPNVILINVGTNDGIGGRPGNAPTDMRQMLGEIYAELPDTVIVLSTLLPSGIANAQAGIREINAAYRQIVRDLAGQGRHIVLAEMDDGYFITLANILDDGIHPTDQGFRRMASVWYAAIDESYRNGWLQAPSADVDFEDDGQGGSVCTKGLASGASDPRGSPQILFALDPVICDDGDYIHSSIGKGSIYTDSDGGDYNYYFAQLFAFEANSKKTLDEIVRMGERSDNVEMKVNNGDGTFGGWQSVDVKFSCHNRGVAWGDVNADGFDDFLCITPNGDLLLSTNDANPGQTPTFTYRGTHKLPVGSQYKQANVRLGDIDGDGRLDYCVIGSTDGHVRCWRNGGIGWQAAYWQDLGQGNPVFYAKGMGDIRGVRFADLNGDGRWNWTWTSVSGKVNTWINQRGDGKGMVPHWRDAGVSHAGQPEGTGESRDNIQFPRIFGSDPPKADYVYIKKSDGGVDIRAWQNVGSGGKHQKGDGVFFGDVTGTGVDDYIWIDKNGKVNVYPNMNTSPVTTDNMKYGSSAAWGAARHTVVDTKLLRRALHIADWNGDGLADIVAVDNNNGNAYVWTNDGDGSSFSARRTVAGGLCNIKRGPGYTDQPAHLADLNGDGRADVICMEKSGRAIAWLNEGSGLRSLGQIKFSQDLDRANFQFGDVNGKSMQLPVLTLYSIGGVCNVDIDLSAEECSVAWARSIALWSSQNYARFLQLLYESYQDAALEATLNLGSMTNLFIYQEETVELGQAAWLTMFAGIFTSIGAALPGLAAIGTNVGAGILTVAAGTASGSSPSLDPRFDDWASLSSNFADVMKQTRDVLSDYFDRMLTELPDSLADGSGETDLSRVLGSFVDDAARVDANVLDIDNQRTAIQAGLINMLWREQQIFLVQIPRGQLLGVTGNSDGQTFDYDPCFGTGAPSYPGGDDWAATLGNKVYCTDEDSWMILNWQTDRFVEYFGTSEDDLEDLGVSRELVAETSRQTQDQMQGFDPIDTPAVADYLQSLSEDFTSITSIQDMLRFNLPVCEMEGIQNDNDGCWVQSDGPGETDPNDVDSEWEICLMSLIRNACSRFYSYGNEWPYDS